MAKPEVMRGVCDGLDAIVVSGRADSVIVPLRAALGLVERSIGLAVDLAYQSGLADGAKQGEAAPKCCCQSDAFPKAVFINGIRYVADDLCASRPSAGAGEGEK